MSGTGTALTDRELLGRALQQVTWTENADCNVGPDNACVWSEPFQQYGHGRTQELAVANLRESILLDYDTMVEDGIDKLGPAMSQIFCRMQAFINAQRSALNNG